MPRIRTPERQYYDELFEMLDIPYVRRRSDDRLYFINPITGKDNDVALTNLRRAVDQMVREGIMDYEILYSPTIDVLYENEITEVKQENVEHDEVIERKETYDNPTFSSLRQLLKDHKGETVRIIIYKDGKIPLDATYHVPTMGFGGFWEGLTSTELIVDSDHPLIPIGEYTGKFLEHSYSMDFFVIEEIRGGNPISQRFNEGLKHCILYPIQEWAEGCFENAKYKRGKQRYAKILKDVSRLMEEYKDGVPETKLQGICELLQIDIKVDLPLDIKEPFIYCTSTKKRLKAFEFINTRLDHVDLNEIVLNQHIKNITRDEIYELKDQLDSDQEYYIYKKDMRGLSSITTFKGKYVINNKYSTTVREFEDQEGFNPLKIDDIDDSNLSTFIKCGTHYNLTVDFKDIYPFTERRLAEVKHIDMERAYANFHQCKWYEGFMGKITDFRKTDKIQSVGMYLVNKFDFTNADKRFKKYNEVLKIYQNENVYGSPELKMLSEYNVKYTIKAGCWGVKAFDFKFNKNMLESRDDDDIKYYARWTGACDQHTLEQSFYMKGDVELFQNIRNYTNDGIVRWVGVDEGCLTYKKNNNYHLGHITGQITMYQRMSMMEQLQEIDPFQIIRVCVDGIYYIGDEPVIKNVFRPKNDKHFGNEAGDIYISNVYIDESIYDVLGFKEFAPEREHFGKELHLGAGGTGKTHKALTDKGLVKVLYVAPSRKLVRNKNAEYSITADVLYNLITSDTERFINISRYFNVLVFDEVSMYDEKSKQLIFERFDSHKLIFCGDIGFQLPPIEGKMITEEGFDLIKNHCTNYRIKCKELQLLCDLLRSLILRGIKNNCIDNYRYRMVINDKVKKFFTKRNRMIDKDELKEIYDIKDYLLVGTKEVGYEYTNMFKGTFEEEKYYVTTNSSEYSNGDIIYSKIKPIGCVSEIRHHFTTHSIQGETIKSPRKIFIDISKMFDSRMFYTAISRARKLEQIYLVC